MSELYLIGILAVSYLLGSFPTSILVSQIKANIDIREHGSGNAGGMNVLRTLGAKPFLIVVVVDVLKGWLPVAFLAPLVVSKVSTELPLLQVLCGMAAIVGHTYPVFAKFKGGKGVATFAGVALALYPLALPVSILAFIGTFILTGYASVSSLSASLTFAALIWLLNSQGIERFSPEVLWFSILIPLYLLFTHRANVKRLLQGNENRFTRVMIFKKNK